VSDLEEFYDAYTHIEEEFQAALDLSLGARGPDMLYDLVEALGLPGGATALDIGCGRGRQALVLAQRFGLAVAGIDPVAWHIEVAAAALAEAAVRSPELPGRVRFERGAGEALAFPGESFDLVWCKDVLGHVADLEQAYREFRRVLRPGGRAIVYQSCFATERLEPREAELIWRRFDVVRDNMNPARTDAAVAAAGLEVEDCIEVALEWGEHAQEDAGTGGRRLLHAARLLRHPEQYVERFGQWAYDIMLGDCLWHIYRMIGKLGERVYVLSRV